MEKHKLKKQSQIKLAKIRKYKITQCFGKTMEKQAFSVWLVGTNTCGPLEKIYTP
jgi:hypothetical protein